MDARRRDTTLPEQINPYRTLNGFSKNQTALMVVGVTATLFLTGGLLALLNFENTASGQSLEYTSPFSWASWGFSSPACAALLDNCFT